MSVEKKKALQGYVRVSITGREEKHRPASGAF
jgi:hypothetical protein